MIVNDKMLTYGPNNDVFNRPNKTFYSHTFQANNFKLT